MDKVFNNFTGKGQRLLAYRIDEQLQQLICRQIANVFDKLSSGLGGQLKLEIDSIVEAVYYLFSIKRSSPTPGMRAVDLTISGENKSWGSVGLAFLVAKYGVQKLQTISNYQGWREKDDVSSCASIANYNMTSHIP